MSNLRLVVAACLAVVGLAVLPGIAVADQQITVTVAGDGSGAITSNPAGIDCTTGGTGACAASFTSSSPVTLSASAATGSGFAGFSGACTGQTCSLTGSGSEAVTATFDGQPTISVSAPDPDGSSDYPAGSTQTSGFTCTADSSSTLSSCTASVDGGTAEPSGSQLPTSVVGAHSIVIAATDSDGVSASQTVDYSVEGPTESVTTPASGDPDYPAGSVPDSAFTCTAASGQTVTSCTASVDGGTAFVSGTALPGGVGSHTMVVTGVDTDGATTSQTVDYSVEGPTESITTPATGDPDYPAGSVPDSAFTCTAASGQTVTSCTASVDGGTAFVSGTALPGGVGSHTMVVTGVDSDNATTSTSTSYTVSGPPTVSISSPAPNAQFVPAQAPAAQFSCSPGANTTISNCTGTVDGQPIADGAQLPASPGSHTLSVTAVGADGQQAEQSATYTVSGPPTVTVAAPLDGENYYWQSIPPADFSCAAGVDGTLSSCTATVDGNTGAPFSSGTALPDSIGSHTVTVTATDTDGQSSSQTLSYTASLTLLPFVSITAPGQDSTYTLGTAVKASYACVAAKDGPAVNSCVGTVPDGKPINTASVGKHTFTVTATDASGQSNRVQISYSVIATTARFTLSKAGADRRGRLQVKLKLPGPGKVKIVASAWSAVRGGAQSAFDRHFTYGTSTSKLTSGGTHSFTVVPDARGRALLKATASAPVVQLQITYTPTGGKPRELRSKQIRIK